MITENCKNDPFSTFACRAGEISFALWSSYNRRNTSDCSRNVGFSKTASYSVLVGVAMKQTAAKGGCALRRLCESALPRLSIYDTNPALHRTSHGARLRTRQCADWIQSVAGTWMRSSETTATCATSTWCLAAQRWGWTWRWSISTFATMKFRVALIAACSWRCWGVPRTSVWAPISASVWSCFDQSQASAVTSASTSHRALRGVCCWSSWVWTVPWVDADPEIWSNCCPEYPALSRKGDLIRRGHAARAYFLLWRVLLN